MEKVIKKVPIDLIDEPQNVMRTDLWNEELDDLASSIAQFGLLQPITLRRVEDRFEIISGHRRFLAHRKIGKPTIDSVVIDADNITSDAMKVHENLYRLNVNPVDQAEFLSRYMESNKLDVVGVSEMVKRPVEWVKRRLEISGYPSYLKDVLRAGKLSLGSAYWLSRITNENVRCEYVRLASIQGLNAIRAKYWYQQGNLSHGPVVENGDGVVSVPDEIPIKEPEYECVFCKKHSTYASMASGEFHRDCLEQFNLAVKDIDIEKKS